MMEKTQWRIRKKRRVAVVIETTRSYGRRILEGIADYLQETEPWHIFVEPRALYDPAPKWLHHWEGDGIIARLNDESDIRRLQETGIPFINLKGTPAGALTVPDIVTDRVGVGRMAAEHLLERQFRNFAFVGVPGCSWSDQEFLGFQQTLKEHGFTCEEFQHKTDIGATYRDGAMEEEIDSVATWVKTLKIPVGILAADDYLGVQLLSACDQAGIKVPDMAGVVGVGDEEIICRLSSPTLSSVRPNDHVLGRTVAAMLDRLMRQKEANDAGIPLEADVLKLDNVKDMTGQWDSTSPSGRRGTLMIPPQSVQMRHSSEATAVDDPLVMQAMVFIRENIAERINAADVVEHLCVSRSVVQRHFQKALGRTIYETIIDWKLRSVMELLAKTDLTVRKIARLTGFKHIEHLNNLFKQKMGMSLIAYRKSL